MTATQEAASSLLQLQAHLDRLLSDPSLGWMTFGPGRARVFPPVNVFADTDGIVVRAEVPGLHIEDLEVVIEPRRLVISGERKRAAEDQGSFHRRERQYGRFSRALSLPDDVDTEAASAACSKGVLTIRLPKRPENKPRRIAIEDK